MTAYSPVVKEGLQQDLPAQYKHFILFLRTSFLLKLEILCAFYRRPSHTCKYVYACVCMCAQAFRHLYVLAAQPRCVEARDVDSKQLVYVPLGVTTCAQEVCMRVYGCVLCMPCMHCDVGLKQLLFLYHKEGLFLYHKGGLFLYHKGGLCLGLGAGQNHINMCTVHMYGANTVFLAGKSPNLRSRTVYIYTDLAKPSSVTCMLRTGWCR